MDGRKVLANPPTRSCPSRKSTSHGCIRWQPKSQILPKSNHRTTTSASFRYYLFMLTRHQPHNAKKQPSIYPAYPNTLCCVVLFDIHRISK